MHEIHDVSGDRIGASALYDLLRLRAEVFVVEQSCCYLDPDGADLLASTRHLWIDDVEPGRGPLATLRVLQEDPGTRRIGRVATRSHARGRGLAGRLIGHALATLDRPVVLAAQAHLTGWYETFGFRVDGPDFPEDGIVHTPMRAS